MAGTCQAIQLTWGRTNLGAAFRHYQIQRLDDGAGWKHIARITNESVVAFVDWECRRAVPVRYRIRVVQNDSIPSVWLTTSALTITPNRVGVWYVSNEVPIFNIAAEDIGGKREWDPALNAKYVDLHGRDGGVTFRDKFTRGDSFKHKLILHNIGTPYRPPASPGGRSAFERLVGFSRAPLSYVCILDDQGGRWFSSIKTSNLAVTGQAQAYTVDVDIKEVTFLPSLVDVNP